MWHRVAIDLLGAWRRWGCIAPSAHALAFAAIGCGSGTPRLTAPDGGATNDATVAGDAAAPEGDSGTYHSGSNTCCGPGRSATCCTADAGLRGVDYAPDGAIEIFGARPGGVTESNCFRYGGIFGTCASEGAQFDGKEACVVCCPGLVRVNEAMPNDGGFGSTDGDLGPGACFQILGIFACLPCGDGICEPSENHCTCPADCP